MSDNINDRWDYSMPMNAEGTVLAVGTSFHFTAYAFKERALSRSTVSPMAIGPRLVRPLKTVI